MNNDVQGMIRSLRESIERLNRPPLFLVVEDNEDDKVLLVRELDAFFQRCYIVCCKDGEETVRLLDNIKADAVFLDLSLPKMSGLDVMKAIKERYKTMLVIVTGLKEDSAMTLEAMRLGAVKLLVKPVTQDNLKSVFGSC